MNRTLLQNSILNPKNPIFAKKKIEIELFGPKYYCLEQCVKLGERNMIIRDLTQFSMQHLLFPLNLVRFTRVNILSVVKWVGCTPAARVFQTFLG